MHDSLPALFDRALGDEPPMGELATEAMAIGSRLRRRRRLLTGGGAAGVVTVLVTVIALNAARTPMPEPAEAVAMAMRPACADAGRASFEVAVFLRADVTDQQRDDLYQALRSDIRVREVRYESKQQAYAKFAQMYRDAPDLVAAVKTEQLPESFRVELRDRSGYPRFASEVGGAPGVETLAAARCESGERG